MNEINLKLFSKLASEKLGKEVDFIKFESAGGGYHSDGFKLTAADGSEFFLKYVRSHDLGFEFPERQISSLLVSTGMGQRAAEDGRPVGVVVVNNEDGVILPEINIDTKVYHLQEFAGIGTSYSSILSKNLDKKTIDLEDKKHLRAIAEALIKIHSVKHQSRDNAHLKAVYDDGLRNVLINPELSVMVLLEFPSDHKILNLDGQKEIIGLMYENIKAMMGRHERLTALHGDFWGANLFFREDESLFVVDYSRIPWGDPGIDVGWFMAEYLWLYHSTGNPYFKELVELWLDTYEELSGDKEIRDNIALVIGWTGIVQIFPRWFPDIDAETGTKFISHIKKILKSKKFVWND